MNKRKTGVRWFLTFLILIVILGIWQFTQMPEEPEVVPEQVEDIDWEEIDKIEYISENDVQISRVGKKYFAFVGDTTFNIPTRRMINLFATFNDLQKAQLKPVIFSEWSKSIDDDDLIILKMYRNTEQVIDLYIQKNNGATYFRYMDDTNIYETNTLTTEQFNWLNSLAEVGL